MRREETEMQSEDWRRKKEENKEINIVITNIDETRQQCNQQARKQQTQEVEEIGKEERGEGKGEKEEKQEKDKTNIRQEGKEEK